MKLRLIVVGRDRQDPLVAAANAYGERIAHYYPFETVEVKEEPARDSTPVERVRSLEAERIRKAVSDGDWLIALDERGRELTSIDLAQRFQKWAQEAKATVTFVVGGPSGLDPEFVQKANERWALSKMTLPHRLARLMLTEQLYRACTIVRREPYHK